MTTTTTESPLARSSSYGLLEKFLLDVRRRLGSVAAWLSSLYVVATMRFGGASMVVVSLLLTADRAWAPGEEYGKHDLPLIRALTRSKLTLAEAIGNAAKRGAPIAAHFELDDAGRLSVVVRVAAQGLGIEVENNSFADLRADPAKPWSPRAVAIKDGFLLSRASQQVLLLALSQKTLLDAATRAQDDGTVYSIAPDMRQRRAVFVALVVSAGKPREIEYELSMR